MFDAIEIQEQLKDALTEGKQHIGAQIGAQQKTMETIEAPGVLDEKTKLLIALGAIAYVRCEDCVSLHMPRIVAAGATKEEVMEAASVAICFGGGPTMAFVTTVIGPAYDQFRALARHQDTPTGDGLFD